MRELLVLTKHNMGTPRGEIKPQFGDLALAAITFMG
jgi:hypothetical protein